MLGINTIAGFFDSLTGRARATPAPTLGPAATGPQARKGGSGTFFVGNDPLKAPPPGTYATYREMRKDPTIEIGRAAATIPIKAAAWAYEAGENGTDAQVEFVRKTLEPLRARLVHDAMYALDYGWASWEIVWESKGGKIVPRLKALLVDVTDIEVDKQTGGLVGVSQAAPPPADGTATQGGRVLLSGPKKLHWAHDREADNWHGRSRMENIREHAYAPWKRLAERVDKMTNKAAGTAPIVTYPQGGEWKDQNGGTVTADQAAQNAIAAIMNNGAVAIPRMMDPMYERLLQNTTAPEKLLAWDFRFQEITTGPVAEMNTQMRYYDSLKVRGWLTPERSVNEGQHGTLAEAEAHTDLGIAIAGATLEDLLAAVNDQLVDVLLELNYGPQARGSVRVKAAAASSEDLKFLRDIVKAVLTNPANLELLLATTDIDAALDQTGVPKTAEVIDLAATMAPADPNAPAAPADPPLARMMRRYGSAMARMASHGARRVA